MRPIRRASGEDLIRDVSASLEGPCVAAFFDLDRTLIDGYSAIAFLLHRLRSGQLPASELAASLSASVAFRLGRVDFATFLSESIASTRGRAEAVLERLGEAVFEEMLVHWIFPEARRLVAAHRRRGHFVAIITSATRYQVEPVARALGIEFVACSALELRGGAFTGRIVQPVCYGEGKLAAARRFGRSHPFALEASYFYTDSHEDLPLLEAVGHPRPVNPTRKLAATAELRGWSTHVFEAPPNAISRGLASLGSRWSTPRRSAPRPGVA